jgi:hypothetical protein
MYEFLIENKNEEKSCKKNLGIYREVSFFSQNNILLNHPKYFLKPSSMIVLTFIFSNVQK